MRSQHNKCCIEHEVIGGVFGRQAYTLRYGDVDVHSYCLRAVILDFPEIKSYQYQQRPNGLVLVLDECSHLSPGECSKLKQQITTTLNKLGILSPDVEVKHNGSFIKTRAGKIPIIITLGDK